MRLIVLCLLLLFCAIAALLAPAAYRHVFVYPRLEREAERLAAMRNTNAAPPPLQDFRGVMHAHTYWSHDSRGTLPQILAAAQQAEIDFIFFTDHPRADLDTFPRPFQGRFGHVLIVSGAEKRGLLVWPLHPGVIDWRVPVPHLVDSLRHAGGLIFFAHSEKPHPWKMAGYHGMEIYNIHTDIKDEALWKLLPDLLLNRRYHRWIYRRIFDPQTAILQRWDRLNRSRRVVGIAANDAHDNQHLRVRRRQDGGLEWIGPNAQIFSPGFWGVLLRPFFHAPDSAGFVFRWDIDPYFESFRFVNTHILADSLNLNNLRRHLLAGHVFIAFESLAPARGFSFSAETQSGFAGLMGDEVPLQKTLRLQVVTPRPGRIHFMRNGEAVGPPVTGESATMPVKQAGNYRVRVDLHIGGRWVPWIYSNPIRID